MPRHTNTGRDAQIEIMRVLCILSMIWVHVAPGIYQPSFVTRGSFAFVGAVLGDGFGRASVSALSFISGWLLWRGARGVPILSLLRSKFRVLIVPMVVWELIYVLMAVLKVKATGQGVNGLNGVFDSPFAFFNAVTGFAAPSANITLFFIRDLFVCGLIVRLLVPLLPRFGWVFLGLALVMTLGGYGPPVIFRPSILLFFVAGTLWGVHDKSLADLGAWRLVLPVAIGAGVLWLLFRAGVPMLDPPFRRIAGSAADVSLRIALTLVTAGVAGWLSGKRVGARIAPFGAQMYLGYLMHIPLIGALWVVWARLIGDQFQPTYLLFYLLCPFVTAAMGMALSALLDRAPGWLQISLRGKARRVPGAPAEKMAGVDLSPDGRRTPAPVRPSPGASGQG